MLSSLNRLLVTWLTSIVLLLSGCGGGSKEITANESVARIEVTPTAILLNGLGQRQVLTVRAFGASGAEIYGAPLKYTSSLPDQISIDASGTVSAVMAIGSAQISVTSGAVSATPILAIAAETYPGTVLVSDEQITMAPQPVPYTVVGVGAQYVVGMRGIATPPVGAIVLATGSSPVAGKVVSVAIVDGGSIAVTLEVIPISEMFRNLSVSQVFTPEQVSKLMVPASVDAHVKSASGVAKSVTAIRFGSFVCEPTFDPALLKLDIAPSVDVSLGAALDLSVLNGVSKSMLIQVEGTIKGDVAGSVTLGSVKGDLKCRANLFA